MPRSEEYMLGYSRGYNAGRGPNWPAHKPPRPPDEMIEAMMESTHKLRDSVDSILATIDEEDEWSVQLGPLIDDVDAQMIRLGDWLKDKPAPATPNSGSAAREE